MSMTVTVTEGGAISAGVSLAVQVVTGAKSPSAQLGAAMGAQSSTPNLSITPDATGSLLFSSVLSGGALPVAETGEAEVYVGGNTSLYYSFYNSTSTTTAGSPVLMGSSVGTGVAISTAEILANGSAASLWPEQPEGVTNTSVTDSVTTAGFTPPPGALLVALVATNGIAGTTTVTISDSLGLTWTCLQQEDGGGNGYVGVWIARMPDPLPNLAYVYDVTSRSTTSNVQTVDYTPQSQKSLIVCCGSLYSSDNTVQGITSISDSANNTWFFSTTEDQFSPYIGHTVSGQFYNAFIGWTWQDKGIASAYNVNFSGNAYLNMDISEWSGAGSMTSGGAAAGVTSSANLDSPIGSVTVGSIGIAITNTINGSFSGGTVMGSDGMSINSMPNEPISNFVIFSGNSTANPLLPSNSPYSFTYADFGSGADYCMAFVIINPRGAPTGAMFRGGGIPGL